MVFPDLLQTGRRDNGLSTFRQITQVSGDIKLFSGSQNKVDPFEGSNLFGVELGITTDHHHECRRIGAESPAYGIPAALVAGMGDRTGIDDI